MKSKWLFLRKVAFFIQGPSSAAGSSETTQEVASKARLKPDPRTGLTPQNFYTARVHQESYPAVKTTEEESCQTMSMTTHWQLGGPPHQGRGWSRSHRWLQQKFGTELVILLKTKSTESVFRPLLSCLSLVSFPCPPPRGTAPQQISVVCAHILLEVSQGHPL